MSAKILRTVLHGVGTALIWTGLLFMTPFVFVGVWMTELADETEHVNKP